MVMDKLEIREAVIASLQEDIGEGDITAALIEPGQAAQAEVVCRDAAILCGQAWAEMVFSLLDPSVELTWLQRDGDELVPDHVFLKLKGPAQALLTGERAMLNWLQTLSATATVAHRYSQALAGTACQLLDTRKTIPGLRAAQKYAVRCGGGQNHRMGLYDAYLIKENHIISCGSIQAAVSKARELHADKPVEVEVESLNELAQALQAKADIVMLDNFSLRDMEKAVLMNQGTAKLEVSGNVEQGQLADIAATGVDYISSGALTKHVQAVDLSMRIVHLDQA